MKSWIGDASCYWGIRFGKGQAESIPVPGTLRYFNKVLSARLSPTSGREAGQLVEVENPIPGTSTVVKLNLIG